MIRFVLDLILGATVAGGLFVFLAWIYFAGLTWQGGLGVLCVVILILALTKGD